MTNPYAVIMAGGAGTRFWPASRVLRPKQLLALGPSPQEPLVAATVRRILPLCSADRIFIATGQHLLADMRKALPAIPAENFLAEPIPRNTAPCIGWATAAIARRDPEANIMVLPSDHHIGDEEGFRQALVQALDVAEPGVIGTIGIRPTRPETGYGYIELGESLRAGAFRVARFVEKPDTKTASQYLASGRYLWNSGMFFFRAASMLDAIRRHVPGIATELSRLDEAARMGREQSELRDAFAAMPSVSIDYGVMEKAERVAVLPASFGWNDLGSWQSTWELAAKDAAENAAPEGALVLSSHGNLVADLRTDSARRVVALVGVDNLAVIATDDAILVIPRDRAQDVRLAIDELKRRGLTDKL